MKFLLIRPGDWKKNVKYFIASPSSFPPLGLLYVASTLEQKGHKVEILDYYKEENANEKLKSALMSADAVGMGVSTNELNFSINISDMIKDIDANIPVIIGGPHCAFSQKQTLKDIPNADICIIGEGEYAILELVSYFNGKNDISNVHGIYYRDNSSIISGKPLKVIDNLDDLPFPSRHLVEKYDYGNFSFGLKFKKKVTSSISSRGCPFHCRFCTRYSNVLDGWGFRQRSSQNVLQEFEELDEHYGSMFIIDDCFLADKKRAHTIFDGLIYMGSDIDLYIGGTRADYADKDLYKKMKKAGVKTLLFGLESGNQDVLDFYDKRVNVQQIKETIQLAREMNFFTVGSFILGAPIETKEHIENTINFACSLPLDVALFSPLSYMKGSQIWYDAVQKNLISSDTTEVLADSRQGLGNFTLEELVKYGTDAFQRFYFRPTYILGQIYRSILRNDYNLLFNGLNYLFRVKKIEKKARNQLKQKET
jgi:anaerobic magnesium-protoporphyrin IX monomethyl ester cyclase